MRRLRLEELPLPLLQKMNRVPAQNKKHLLGHGVFGNERGFALLLSLLIVFLLVVMIFEADYQIRADLRAAGNFRDDLKAYYLARSGISAGEALLKDDAVNSNKYDGLDEFWAFPIPDYPLGDGLLSGTIVDEERKINLNTLLIQGKTVDPARKEQLERLFVLLELNPELVDAIVDWVDPDDEPRTYGAESPTYQSREPGYRAKDGKMETLSELRMVQGITSDIYAKVAPYLTVYGDGRINVNTVDRFVLQSLDHSFDETEARRLTEARPFETAPGFKDLLPEEVKTRMNSDGRLIWFITGSHFFTIQSIGQVNDTRKTATAVVRRQSSLTTLLYFRVE